MERAQFALLAFSAAGLCAYGALAGPGTGDGKISIVRPGPCAAQSAYLLAEHSGALIHAPIGRPALQDHIIVFRDQPSKGWASRRLLQRFDLNLEEEGVRIVNSGAFCVEER